MTADELPKVYDLPNLAPAPSSTLQGLLRRLIEYADWTAARGILDCLKEDERRTDLREFREWLGRMVVDEYQTRYVVADWRRRCRFLVTVFFFDLFTLDAAIAHMVGLRALREDEVEPMADGLPPDDGMEPEPPVAECDIPAGAAVAVDWNTGTVRLHPNPPAAGADA